MCGILAVFSKYDVNSLEFIKYLEKIQHRGQDSCGIAYTSNINRNIIEVQKNMGMVKDLHRHSKVVNSKTFIGHTRYTTSGQRINNTSHNGIHPIVSSFNGNSYAFVFNGNIPFISEKFSMDTEYIQDYISRKQLTNKTFRDVLLDFIRDVPRAFNIIFLYMGDIYAIRDVYGTRPFKLLKTKDDNRIYLSSEDYFLEEDSWINYDLPEGSLTIITPDLDIETIPTILEEPKYNTAHCVFEHIYFMNEKSMTDEFLVKDSRVQMGHLLANKEEVIPVNSSLDNFIVSSVPNTANTSAEVYATTLGIEYRQFIKKNKNVSRTFIITDEGERNNYSREKYILDADIINGRDIILVDDSIVRGTTLKTLISLLIDFNPKSVHVRITSPPITNTCNLGIDIPTQEELIYNKFNDIEKMREYLNVDSLKYLDTEDLKHIFSSKGMCMGCINGDYNKNKDLEW